MASRVTRTFSLLPLLVGALAVSAVGVSRPAGAGPRLACATVSGPCNFLGAQDVLLPPSPDAPPIFATNFGILQPAGSGWEVLCDDLLGGPIFSMTVRAFGRGGVIVAPRFGVVAFEDACGPRQAGGSLALRREADAVVGPAVVDLAVGSSGDVWAVTRDRQVHAAKGGSLSFAVVAALDAGSRPSRILLAPSDPRRIYVGGRVDDQALVLQSSQDGGMTWTEPTAAGGDLEPTALVWLLDVHPKDPALLFLYRATNDGGDELFRSTDGGRRWQRVLKLAGLEAFAGLAFDEASDAVFVAGRASLVEPGPTPAHLYVSRDRGATWPARIPSGPAGPIYRCLAHRSGVLYACGGGPDEEDQILFGASMDEGRSWRSVVDPGAIAGPTGCAAGACAATAAWLATWRCERLGRCAGRVDAGAPVTDGGAPPAKAVGKRGGCSGAGRASGGAGASFLVALFVFVRLTAARRSR